MFGIPKEMGVGTETKVERELGYAEEGSSAEELRGIHGGAPGS